VHISEYKDAIIGRFIILLPNLLYCIQIHPINFIPAWQSSGLRKLRRFLVDGKPKYATWQAILLEGTSILARRAIPRGGLPRAMNRET
jgi:hypothetical protein